MFVVLLTYTKPMDAVEAVRGIHREFLDRLYQQNILLASGPQIPKTGGVLIARGGRSKDELMDILREDPFYIQDMATYNIIEFDPVKHHAAIKDLL